MKHSSSNRCPSLHHSIPFPVLRGCPKSEIVQRITIAEISHDKKGCFDRTKMAHSNIYARKQNVDKNLVLCRSRCVKGMRRHVKKGLGMSQVRIRTGFWRT